MDARRGRVHTPEHDQSGFRNVLVGNRRHLAVERHVRRAGRSGADGAREARRAEAPPQLGVEIVLRQQAVGAAVRIRQDRFGAGIASRALEPIDHTLHGFVPGNALEPTLALEACSNRRMEQAVGPVHPLAEFAHFRTDVPFGDRVLVRAVYLQHLPALDRNRQTAGVGTVERAGGFDNRRRSAKDRFSSGWHDGTITSQGSSLKSQGRPAASLKA